MSECHNTAANQPPHHVRMSQHGCQSTTSPCQNVTTWLPINHLSQSECHSTAANQPPQPVRMSQHGCQSTTSASQNVTTRLPITHLTMSQQSSRKTRKVAIMFSSQVQHKAHSWWSVFFLLAGAFKSSSKNFLFLKMFSSVPLP